MGAMTFLLRWSWVLGIALLAPVALPAGGGTCHLPEERRLDRSTPLLSLKSCILHPSPSAISPALRSIQIGTPLSILRTWRSVDGSDWIMVKISSEEFLEMSNKPTRGWIQI